ncbi:MAG: putative transposase [Verrucomicrobiales bacterium]|jgi:putative transposase
MPQSLHVKYSHLVFSTKNRDPLITGDIKSRLYEYMGGIARDLVAACIEINGIHDHVHLIIRDSKSCDDIKFIKELKGSSSRWANSELNLPGRFSWQAGYGWFSVGPTDLDKASAYVKRQKEHHKKITFQDEYRKFLEQYKVEYDERYVWD